MTGTSASTGPRAQGKSATSAETAAAKSVRDTILLLMGVSGSGKTTIALELRRLLGWQFADGDDLQLSANVEKMRAGHPLSDEDRRPWLERVARWIDEHLAAGTPGIVTCSNLKRSYRRMTIGSRKGVMLVHLRGPEPLIAMRIAERRHWFMPTSLLRSQFETLEEPMEDEHPIVVSVEGSVAGTVIDLLGKVAAEQARGR
ncbi:MAG TPA: gluconokinase [Acetobacteraceae bacterium]|nr:gluconokinase [Acetobacteraceae bacterium]